jgi:hypothetical protein
MAIATKERWREAQVVSLPAGEHDFFERKSGALLSSADLRKDLGKAVSALANSGGGHLILGVRDDGTFDGLDLVKSGRTTSRDWLEQIVPNLVDFPLRDFRVHQVEPATPTSIPEGKGVIVVDIGDSTLAPHQVEESRIYFYRQGGRSVPAPHFYLETLRNRLVGPMLTVKLTEMGVLDVRRLDENEFFVLARLKFLIVNDGRVAAYKWALIVEELEGNPDILLRNFPIPVKTATAGIALDITILPGLNRDVELDFGFYLRPQGVLYRPLQARAGVVEAALTRVIPEPFEMSYRVVSEISPGEVVRTKLNDIVDRTSLAREIVEQMPRNRDPI